jgi:NADH:ubiquinone oxidoreductase subunit H
MSEVIIISLIKAMVLFLVLFCMLPIAWNIDKKTKLGIQKIKYKSNLGFYAEVFKRSIKREDTNLSFVSNSLFTVAKLVFLLCALSVTPWCEPLYFQSIKIFSELLTLEYNLIYSSLFILMCVSGAMFSMLSNYGDSYKIRIIQDLSNIASTIICLLLVLLSVFMIYTSADLHMIVQHQVQVVFGGKIPFWGIIKQPVNAILFLFLSFRLYSITTQDYSANISSAMAEELEVSNNYFLDILNKYIFLFMISVLNVYLFWGGYSVLPGLDYLVKFNQEIFYIFQAISLLVKTCFLMFIICLIKHSTVNSKSSIMMEFLNGKVFLICLINFLLTTLWIFVKETL